MDLGAITNSTNAVANTYAAKEMKQADEVKKYGGDRKDHWSAET